MSAPVHRTRPRQTPEQTRSQIVLAMLELLREQPFREIGVETVMRRTGHSRTVFYRHFEDIPSLVLAVITEVGGELVEVGADWAAVERTSPAEARARLERFVDFYVRHGPVVRAIAAAAHHDATVDAAYGQMVEGFIAMTTQAIEARIARGELEPLDAPEVARALVRMLNGYLGDALGQEPFTDRERVLETVWTIWTRTLYGGASA
ncbi:TetR family transcriptional regulator [Conexibacter sp. W3-3-2]|uniref:TetR family transcriptional regulator n=1 Tax=Paraconexibacter algicola TaxID=2133960 RepID=A0A2T4UGR2_9ACTN|nr:MULTISPECIES: TetR/AcrR family transcriptional regulator [Solirubrobacterales]MTD44658.1 TetR family transcriptional regulator [Conexibacter sp. W3-3-2]PTL58399.1 TetR family transcriptional regulator [Paraconexibacter algicola]